MVRRALHTIANGIGIWIEPHTVLSRAPLNRIRVWWIGWEKNNRVARYLYAGRWDSAICPFDYSSMTQTNLSVKPNGRTNYNQHLAAKKYIHSANYDYRWIWWMCFNLIEMHSIHIEMLHSLATPHADKSCESHERGHIWWDNHMKPAPIKLTWP